MSVRQRQALTSIIDEFDELAWSIEDQSHGSQNSKYLRAFSRARAVSAAFFAAADEPVAGATEAAYEAQAATDEIEELRALISNLVGA